MAVKKHELVRDNRNQLDLSALAQYIQLMNEQPNYLPPPNELVKNCQNIVKCLAHTNGHADELWELLQSVEEFLLRVVNSVHSALRHEIVTAVLDKFYSIISDPQSEACPATSVVLIVLDVTDNESVLSAARWLVQQRENGPAGAGLRASLSCLYRWMIEWHGTPALGTWTMAYIKALEENERFDVLIEVSVENLARLFQAIDQPVCPRECEADVIFHVLSSLRESMEAFDRISGHVERVLMNLAADSGRWSRQLLQTVVDILSCTVDTLAEIEGGDAFRNKHCSVLLCLEQYMVTRGSKHLNDHPWKARNKAKVTKKKHMTLRKVGLLNLGNTCYMNSVMQALLATKQFSTHVMLKMTAAPYWSKLGVLFAKMMHSVTTKLDPDEFFAVVNSPFFTRDNQHDSSEFLGYLFELLQAYEHMSDVNFDYSRPPVLAGGGFRIVTQSPSDSEEPDSTAKCRSNSPRPGSSAAGSSSGIQKRSHSDELALPPKKRMRMNEETAYLRRDSYIDSLFGGVLLTRVQCTECRSSSLSRDVFRDLQLAFPEKPEGWQHSVQSLLEFYCSKESLSGENQYQCRDCGGLRDAERSVLIERSPKYLILVLKNFKYEPKLQVQTKLMLSMYHNHTVILPTVRSQADHPAYSLYAAIVHSGTTLDSGHYYTLVRDNDEWHNFNDDVVSLADESELNGIHRNRSRTPYILFYRRNDIEEGIIPGMEQLPSKVQECVVAHNKIYADTVRKVISRP